MNPELRDAAEKLVAIADRATAQLVRIDEDSTVAEIKRATEDLSEYGAELSRQARTVQRLLDLDFLAEYQERRRAAEEEKQCEALRDLFAPMYGRKRKPVDVNKSQPQGEMH